MISILRFLKKHIIAILMLSWEKFYDIMVIALTYVSNEVRTFIETVFHSNPQ